jgi:hypothetical protein
MTLRVGFDLDGVLADFRSAFSDLARDVLHEEIDAAGGPEAQNRTPGDVERVWKAIAQSHNWWTTIKPFEPEQIARLYALAREGLWEVVFLTKRPPSSGDTVQFQTQWWLERYGYLLPSVITVPGSRGELANALRLDLIVDDQLINCAEILGASTTKAVLVLRDGEPEALRTHATSRGIGVVSTLEQAVDVVHQIQEVLPRRRGRMLRLADWFGPARNAAAALEPVLPRPQLTAKPR